MVITMGKADALDKVYISTGEGGFYQPETLAVDPETTYRWAGSVSYVNLPWPLDAVPLKLTLRAAAPRPENYQAELTTRVTVRGEISREVVNLGTFSLPSSGEAQDYELRLPVSIKPTLESFRVRLETSQFYQPGGGDTRRLAIRVFSLKIESDYANFSAGSWFAWLSKPGLLALIALCCWGITKLLFRRWYWAYINEAVAGAFLVLSLWLFPLITEPYYAPWGLILPLTWFLLWLAGIYTRRARQLPSSFVYAATLYPLLPFAQFAFQKLDLYSLSPYSLTLAVFTGALLYSGGIYVSRNIREEETDDKPMGNPFQVALTRSMVLASVISFTYNLFYLFQTDPGQGVEFKGYYNTFLNYEVGVPLYGADSPATKLSPVFTPILWILVRILGANTPGALLGWRIFNIVLLVPILIMLVKLFGQPKNGVSYTPAVLFFALNFGAVIENLSFGQFGELGMLGLCLFLLWQTAGRDFRAGGWLALAVAIRPAASITAIFSAIERRWWNFTGLAVGGGITVMLCTITVGWGNFWQFITDIIYQIPPTVRDVSNQSVFGFLARLSVAEVSPENREAIASWVVILGYIFALGVIGLTVVVLWRVRGVVMDDNMQLLRLGTLILTSLFIFPNTQFSQFAPALLGILSLMKLFGSRRAPRWQLSLFGIGYAILSYGGSNNFFPVEIVGLNRLGSSYRFLVMLTLWLLCLFLLWKRRSEHLKTPGLKKQ